MDWLQQILPAQRDSQPNPAVVPQSEPPAPGPLGRFRSKLRRVEATSSVGISTLSGESPRSLALVRLAGTVGELDAAGQVLAIEELLASGAALFPDQYAHVVSALIHDLVCTGKLPVADAVRPSVARQLILAGLAVAPELRSSHLVSDTAAQDLLSFYMTLLADQASLGLPPMRARLEAAGLLEPSTAMRFRRGWDGSPDGMAHWLRGRVSAISIGQVRPDELSPLLTYVAMLPEHLRGRILTLLYNVLPNAARLRENEALLLDIGRMVDALPALLRFTPLEAYHNSMVALPHEAARLHLPLLRAAVSELGTLEDARVARSHADLRTAIAFQGEMLQTSDLLRGESLRDLHERRKRSEALDQRQVF